MTVLIVSLQTATPRQERVSIMCNVIGQYLDFNYCQTPSSIRIVHYDIQDSGWDPMLPSDNSKMRSKRRHVQSPGGQPMLWA